MYVRFLSNDVLQRRWRPYERGKKCVQETAVIRSNANGPVGYWCFISNELEVLFIFSAYLYDLKALLLKYCDDDKYRTIMHTNTILL